MNPYEWAMTHASPTIGGPALTAKQQRLLAYLAREIHNRGHAPSLREIAGAFGISHAAVAQTLKALEAKGVLVICGCAVQRDHA